MGPCSVDSDLGNVVLAAAQDRALVLKGGCAEDLNVDDFTVSLVRVPERDNRVCKMSSRIRVYSISIEFKKLFGIRISN